MSVDRRDTRCAVCATTEGPFECHHVALRANHEGATVDVCGTCHGEQTDHQRRAGLIGPYSMSAGDPTLALLRAITEGLAGIFGAYAQHTRNVQLSRYIDRDRRVTLRLLASVSDERPGTVGSRPITNERRAPRRQASNTSGMTSDADSLQALAGVIPALLTAVSTPPRPGAPALLPGAVELLRGFTIDDAASLFTPAGASRLARGLAKLEHHPRISELAVIIERTSALGSAVVRGARQSRGNRGTWRGTDQHNQARRAWSRVLHGRAIERRLRALARDRRRCRRSVRTFPRPSRRARTELRTA